MVDATKIQLLRDSKLAAELTPEQCGILAESMTIRDLADDEILAEGGATPSSISS